MTQTLFSVIKHGITFELRETPRGKLNIAISFIDEDQREDAVDFTLEDNEVLDMTTIARDFVQRRRTTHRVEQIQPGEIEQRG